MKTKSISYPRSGHKLLADLLGYYFNQEYPDIRGATPHFYASEHFVYCQKHGHCRVHPCTDPRTNYQKDHDFQLDTPITPSMGHVIQVRHPLNSLPSWYLWRLKRKTETNDSRPVWEAFARQQIEFWKGFVRKWLLKDVPNRVVITYEQLLADPKDCIKRALRVMGTEADPAAVERSVASKDICIKNRASDFKYYDRRFFNQISRIAEPELGALGYRRDSYAA